MMSFRIKIKLKKEQKDAQGSYRFTFDGEQKTVGSYTLMFFDENIANALNRINMEEIDSVSITHYS